jgi:hypothetical protein
METFSSLHEGMGRLGSRISNEAEPIVQFQHQPLDCTEASIRLLRILPELSSQGHVRCQTWHSNIRAEYTCLSYVWGSNDDERVILINEKYFRVRRNLFEFLHVARTKYADSQRSFWVDAICIDQTSIMERNHQVTQMGSIYAKADEVIGWFGHSQGIERALRHCVDICTAGPHPEREAWRLWYSRSAYPQDAFILEDWSKLQMHPYWARAWVRSISVASM